MTELVAIDRLVIAMFTILKPSDVVSLRSLNVHLPFWPNAALAQPQVIVHRDFHSRNSDGVWQMSKREA